MSPANAQASRELILLSGRDVRKLLQPQSIIEALREAYGWLKPGEMLDGLGMAETTPGPLIMVLQFVGFMAAFRDPGTLPPMLAGTLGGLLATWVTFTPCFLWISWAPPSSRCCATTRRSTARCRRSPRRSSA